MDGFRAKINTPLQSSLLVPLVVIEVPTAALIPQHHVIVLEEREELIRT